MAVNRERINPLRVIIEYSDLLVVAAVLLVVVMMVIPMPPAILDILLAANISFSILILLLTMNIFEPLEMAVFPTLLLICTLFRLALSVSSTRLILLHGFAGNIISAFGNFVVGGNYVVGFIIFLILVVIQFIVITRGAERVAEVAARFTLDAMPGKQMSIDADLGAGLITEAEARSRRRKIEQEADFYGAMDGASKFVKGDAIAGIIIVIIDIIGGLIVGVFQMGLGVEEALAKFTLLTVGDGLVSQIPALLIATATGIIVTRVASDENLGIDMTQQLFSNPKVMGLASAVLLLFAFVPGLPVIPFLVMGGIIGLMAYGMRGMKPVVGVQEKDKAEDTEEKEIVSPDSILPLLKIDPLELEIGYSLIPLVEPDQGGDMLERLGSIRRQLALDLGIITPLVRVRDNVQLKPGGYRIKVHGNTVAEGELRVGEYLAIDSGIAQEKLEGIQTQEPAFGIPATWISKDMVDKAESLGYTVVDPASVMATHLAEVIRSFAHELLNRQHTKQLIDSVKEEHPVLIEELIPDLLSVGEIQKVLQNLLRERVSIRDLVTILEALSDAARVTRDIQVLTEHVRTHLARTICKPYVGEDGIMRVIVLDGEIEERFANMQDDAITFDPEFAQKVLSSIAEQCEVLAARGQEPVILCSPEVRPRLRAFTEPTFSRVPVLSYRELDPSIRVESVGVVRVA